LSYGYNLCELNENIFFSNNQDTSKAFQLNTILDFVALYFTAKQY